MIGDSITAGVCGDKGGYPTLVQGLLGANYKVSNFGNSGKTMLKYGQGTPPDSSYWNQSTWQKAQADDSDIYTILLGTNDSKNGPGAYNWCGTRLRCDRQPARARACDRQPAGARARAPNFGLT